MKVYLGLFRVDFNDNFVVVFCSISSLCVINVDAIWTTYEERDLCKSSAKVAAKFYTHTHTHNLSVQISNHVLRQARAAESWAGECGGISMWRGQIDRPDLSSSPYLYVTTWPSPRSANVFFVQRREEISSTAAEWITPCCILREERVSLIGITPPDRRIPVKDKRKSKCMCRVGKRKKMGRSAVRCGPAWRPKSFMARHPESSRGTASPDEDALGPFINSPGRRLNLTKDNLWIRHFSAASVSGFSTKMDGRGSPE